MPDMSFIELDESFGGVTHGEERGVMASENRIQE
jgi:hypothetical protein